MKGIWQIAFGVACGLLAAGLILLVAQQPRGQAIQLLPPPTPAPLIVHVAGAVVSPGVYHLPSDSRVQQAIDAAGGPMTDADLQTINLAAPVLDGSYLWVPSQIITTSTITVIATVAPPTPAFTVSGSLQLVNINTASQEELESLPGIGPALAKQIIAYRTVNGPFKVIEDILDVPGIGPKTFEKIKALITV
mgnify:CR=1 FL=1